MSTQEALREHSTQGAQHSRRAQEGSGSNPGALFDIDHVMECMTKNLVK